MDQVVLSQNNIVTPTDVSASLSQGSQFNGIISFSLPKESADIFLKHRVSEKIPYRYTISYGRIKWDALLSYDDSSWLLECRFSTDKGSKFLRELTATISSEAILTFDGDTNILSYSVVNPYLEIKIEKKPECIFDKIPDDPHLGIKTERKPECIFDKIPDELVQTNLCNSPSETTSIIIPRDAIVYPENIIFFSEKELLNLKEIQFIISAQDLTALVGETPLQTFMTDFPFIYSKKKKKNNKIGCGILHKFGEDYRLYGTFPLSAIYGIINGLQIDNNRKLRLTYNRIDGSFSISHYPRKVKKTKNNGPQNPPRHPRKNFVPGGDHEKLFPVTNPKPEGLDRIIW